jgi:hypothetical protein
MRTLAWPRHLRPRNGAAAFILAALVSGLTLSAAELQAQASTKPSTPSPELEKVRAALAKYADPIAAIHDGYFSTLACIEFPVAGSAGQMAYPKGGMGVHFLNTSLIGPEVDPLRPQVLLYEIKGDKLELVSAEWFVPLATGVKERPQLFGQPFDGPMEGHHPVMPETMHHYDLHVWLWKPNPAGMFSPTNPDVRCPKKGYTVAEAPPKMVPSH